MTLDTPTVTPPPPAARENGSLLIVTRNKPGLYEYVKRLLAGYPRVLVLLDRRRLERRERISPVALDRRRAERRSPPSVNDELRSRGWAMTRRRAAPSEGQRELEG